MNKEQRVRGICIKTAQAMAYRAGYDSIMQKRAISTAMIPGIKPFGHSLRRLSDAWFRGLGQWRGELGAAQSGTRLRALKRLMNPFYNMRHRYVPGHGSKSTMETMTRMGANPNLEDIFEVGGRLTPTLGVGTAGVGGIAAALGKE